MVVTDQVSMWHRSGPAVYDSSAPSCSKLSLGGEAAVPLLVEGDVASSDGARPFGWLTLDRHLSLPARQELVAQRNASRTGCRARAMSSSRRPPPRRPDAPPRVPSSRTACDCMEPRHRRTAWRPTNASARLRSSSHQAMAAASDGASSSATGGGRSEGCRVDVGEAAKHLEVSQVIGQGVDTALPRQDLERGDAKIVDRLDRVRRRRPSVEK
jgi:hypothetical protein